jgi:proteasome lid subunit RPN8/RPN11
MASFIAPRELYRQFRTDLSGGLEAAGFFLADYLPDARSFRLREWRAVPPSGFESRSEFHLVLRDDTRAEIIKWAWDEGASLVEAHSHHHGEARFSPSDLRGLGEWVPHLWWRLRGRPYGALVVDGETLDALAWIEGASTPAQVARLKIDGDGSIRATGRTLADVARRGGQRGGL